MANERLFYPELALFGLTPPKFMNNRNISVEKDFETILPSKLYRCSICRTRFQDLTSFIKACSNHLTDINFNLEYDQEEVSLRANKSVIKEEKNIDFDEKSQEDENEEESNSSDSNSSDDEDVSKPFERRKRRKKTSISLLPEGHVFLCKLCDKTFIRRQTYRDHLHGHENPMIKCCKICSTQFSSGIIANKHKKKFHPELYKKEMQERAEHRAKFGRPRTVYHTIDANSTTNNVRKLKPKIRSLEVVVENIYLPGIFRNDWIYLPKKRDENQDVAEKVKHEQNTTTVFKPTPNVEKGENEYKMSFDETYEYEEVEVKVESNESDKQTETDNEKNNVGHSDINRKSLVSNYYIKPEEIAHVPDFLGAKYIFNVYDDRRNKKLKEIKKSNKKLEGSRKKQNLSDSSSDNDNSKEVEGNESNSGKGSFLKRKWTSYKQSEPKICQICGESRTKSNIRRHIATHCVEEDDQECRICGATHTASNKLREHYARVHNVKFREYLYKMQKEKMEKISNKENISSEYVTCKICYTNMKNQSDLNYHIEMLHNYKPGGGKTKSTDLDCNICGKTFKEAQTRNLHIRRIHKQMFDGQIVCHYCGKDFMGKGYLLSHFRYAHFNENGDFKEGSTKVKVKYEYHRDKQAFICEMCGVIKETKITMMKHRHEKHGVLDPEYATILEKDYGENDCPHCGKHFTSIRKFKDHEKYHLKEQSDLFCQICGIKCKTDIFLKAHLLRHGEKKYFCEVEGCGKGFAVKYDFITHQKRAHGSGETFSCKRCDQVFRTWKLRRTHEETDHGVVKVKLQRNKRLMPNAGYKDNEGGDCRFCGKHFDNYRKWQNHEYHHKKIIPDLHCEICGAKSTTEYNLKRHVERHGAIQYFCDYPGCGKGFTVKHDVRIHARRAHKDLFSNQPQQQLPTISVKNSPVYSESNSQQQVFHIYQTVPQN